VNIGDPFLGHSKVIIVTHFAAKSLFATRSRID
jgi:hypothetical protein